ncbi:MAG: hypothetical protein AAF958_11415 [Planctomycetota bacterium]
MPPTRDRDTQRTGVGKPLNPTQMYPTHTTLRSREAYFAGRVLFDFANLAVATTHRSIPYPARESHV